LDWRSPGSTEAMAGEIITLPTRLTVRVASLALRGGGALATRTLALAGQAAEILRPRGEHSPDGSAWTPAPAAQPPSPKRADAIDFAAPPPESPAHVSEQPILAAEVAEPGAEDGAGAEVRVDEPWPGYRQLNASDVIARIVAADPAELAAIQLFEAANRRRQTVLAAVEQQLELLSRGG
jgi:hypothetical protein